MGRPRAPEASSLREQSPWRDLPTQRAGQLRWVLRETGVCPDGASPEEASPDEVVSLGGGADAQTYLVRCRGRDVVVKLNDHGLEAEARALRAWRATTRSLPEVLGVGTVPSTGTRPARYLVLGALVNDEGDVVQTVPEYLDRSPGRAREVGRAIGAELRDMHQARCRSGFGNFADSPGAERTYGTWSSYLEDFLRQHAGYVTSLGLRDQHIEKACAFIRRCGYVDEPRCLHGDVSIRNVAMLGYDPIRVSLFDPNPLCGDPSWDIAPMTNNVELGERRRRVDGGSPQTLTRDRDLLAGFWESYPPVVADDSLLTAQLVQAVLQAEHRHAASDRGETDDLDVDVAHELIREVMDRMSA